MGHTCQSCKNEDSVSHRQGWESEFVISFQVILIALGTGTFWVAKF